MKKSIIVLFAVCLSVEIVTSLWVWLGQPSHGLADVYEGSFIQYQSARLLPWASVITAELFLLWLAKRLLKGH